MERTANLARLYEEQGYLFPQPALTTEEVGCYRGEVEGLLANHGATGRQVLRHKGHVALAWLAELVRHPVIIEPVSDILGPDILCWTWPCLSWSYRNAGHPEHGRCALRRGRCCP